MCMWKRYGNITGDILMFVCGCRIYHTYVELATYLAIWVLIVEWFERLSSHPKVARFIPVLGSEIVFPR